MNRISGPDGLPHSCAEMVRPSGVFTLIGLCFSGCPMPDCAIATRNAATVNLARRLPGKNIAMVNLPLPGAGVAAGLLLDVQPCVLDELAPFLGLRADKGAELLRRAARDLERLLGEL